MGFSVTRKPQINRRGVQILLLDAIAILLEIKVERMKTSQQPNYTSLSLFVDKE